MISWFSNSVSQILSSDFGRWHSLLVGVTASKRSRCPKARTITLRRGFLKYYSLPGQVQNDLLNGKKVFPKDAIPVFATTMGWFGPYLSKLQLRDEQLRFLLRSCNRRDIECIRKGANQLPALGQYIKELTNIAVRTVCNKWIVSNFTCLSTTEGMYDALNRIALDKGAYIGKDVSSDCLPETNWLFEQMITFLRAETGRRDGYGFSVLGKEAGHVREIAELAGVIITPFVKRKKSIEPIILRDIARVFAGHLKRMGLDKVKSLMHESLLVACTSTFEYNIATYRLFNPIAYLLMARFDAMGIKYEYPVSHGSFLSSDSLGATTATGNMLFLKELNIWIKCQSSHDGHIDKRKELCGRIGAMKLSLSSTQQSVTRYYLFIDGFFDDEDIALLDKAGWDGIYYFDEIEEFVKNLDRSKRLKNVLPKLSHEDDDEMLEAAEESKGYGKKK